MTLPIFPNPITLTDIRDEYGQTGSVSLQDYYAGGGIVPPGTVGYPTGGSSVPIPTSGAISLQDFYGSTSISIIEMRSSGVWTVPAGVTSVYLIVVGGGGGGGMAAGADGGGGGGAGGVNRITSYAVTPLSNISVVVGAGGSGVTGDRGSSGSASTFDAATALGGGGGGGSVNRSGLNGGSGGGGNGYGGGNAGGSAAIPAHGKNGGSAGEYNSGGGGGGFSADGQSTPQEELRNVPGCGGAGLQIILPPNSQITPWTWDGFNGIYGTPYTANIISVGGGGGGGSGASIWPGQGGSYTGGNGAPNRSTAATPGVIYTGGGGGGAYADANFPLPLGANGGSGAVYIIYPSVTIGDGPVNTFSSAMSTNNLAYDGVAMSAGISLNSDGTISAINTTTSSIIRNTIGTNWYSTTTPGIGSSYWAYATYSGSGDGASTITTPSPVDSWVSLSAGQTWTLTSAPNAPASTDPLVPTYGRAQGYLTVLISDSAGGPTRASAVIQLSVISSNTLAPPESGGGG